jgi:hypothetical protein
VIKMGIKDFYPFAIAQGEGLGTAYEYYVKAKILKKLDDCAKRIETVLIYGLPEKYGFSLDFVLFCTSKKYNVDLIESRSQKVSELMQIIEKLNSHYSKLNLVKPNIMKKISKKYDLILSCEHIQSLPVGKRKVVLREIDANSKSFAIFAPNLKNKLHNSISGLKGVSFFGAYYLDMPPFPPGVKKKTGQFRSPLIFWILQIYANLEMYFPLTIQKRYAHITALIKF